MKYSLVIYTYGDSRLKNLEATLYTANMYRDDDFEFILLEQGESFAKSLAKKYGFIYYNVGDGTKSISAARNMGVLKSTGEYVVIHDNDLLIDDMFFYNIKEGCAKFRYFSNFTSVVNLTESLTNRVYSNISNYTFTENELKSCPTRYHSVGNISGADGGSLTVRKDDYLAINGYDEMFVDWGAEDNDFRLRMLIHLKGMYVGVLDKVLYHTWHKSSNLNRSQYSLNSKIYYKRLDRYSSIIKG